MGGSSWLLHLFPVNLLVVIYHFSVSRTHIHLHLCFFSPPCYSVYPSPHADTRRPLDRKSGRGCAKRNATETIGLLPLHPNQARCELDMAGPRAMAPACVCGLEIKRSTAPNVTELSNLATRSEFQSICLLPHLARIVYTCLQNSLTVSH